ncbi:alpha/beta fold hydrolase [Citreicella sp. C3M06]|uniref:alpha/beta fold hydrolase n=1 Tax=Citreicella sp. C3M06 TaxID=2841564 RepID=UPI001C0A510E|nr:alpha/beta fold hydrolase [Citreicella sp. C3M06]
MNGWADLVKIDAEVGAFRLIDAGGAGPVLVLVHGWGGQAAQWSAVVPGLAARFRVLLAEMPGGAGAPLRGPVSMAAMGQGVAAALTAADLSPAILLGHSMGGPVVIEAGLAAPDRVAGMIGLDTLADAIYYGGSDAMQIAARRKTFGADLEGETRRMIDAITAPDTGQGLRAQIARNILAARPEDLLEMRDAMFAWGIADRLMHVKVPLRLINSVGLDAAHRRAPLECLSEVPQAIYGSGHFPQLEMPEQLVPQLLVELDQL